MIRTLYIQGEAAEQASASFEQGVPVTHCCRATYHTSEPGIGSAARAVAANG
jgi:hypothetical protein